MHNNKPERDAILSRYFPQFTPAADQTTSGLSGGSVIIARGQQRLVLRWQHPATASAPFLRQYHVLKRLPASLAPKPQRYGAGWMAVDYLRGEVKTALPATDALAEVLYHLHQQPCFGWRITLLPLLEGYWQQAAPSRRTPFWLRQLKKRRQHKEPGVLRLAPLHMDVHPGNLVHSAHGLRLIDWEYAGDGDIALELAAVWMDDAARQRLVEEYARRANIDPVTLARQVQRWQPWVMMLMAGWYECRWQQTGEQQFITLADEVWGQLPTKG